MATTQSAADYLPAERSLDALRDAVDACRGCELYKNATQGVMGLGAGNAAIMLVGEQPGDQEDRQGLPFVGPAGRTLTKALEDAGIARDKVYLTNAVKHFKWSPKGKRRIHETPRAGELRACLPWLEAEIEVVQPGLIACLGATAVTALLKSAAKVRANRGQVIESSYGPCLVTVHPSSILRTDPEEREAAYDLLVQDLRKGVDFLQRAGVSLR